MPSEDILARASDALERTRARERATRTVAKAGRRAARAVKFAGVGAVAVLLAAIIYGLFLPLGVTGVMVTFLLMLMAVVLGVVFSKEAPVVREAIGRVELKALPQTTHRWLDDQRRLLPAPAQSLIDGIGVKLETLGLQLDRLDEREPAAQAVRKLIADELPELVEGYTRLPPAMRRTERDGLSPDRQLSEGLSVVDAELQRMSEQLATGDLTQLATQGRYLEIKYQGDAG